MSGPNRLRLFYLLHLSKPSSDHLIYREIRRQKARKIVELGIGAAERSLRMIEILSEFHDARDIHYTGIDVFEDRSPADPPGLCLKDAHRILKATGARIQLMPGTPSEALPRIANALDNIDTLILSTPIAEPSASFWFYVPRILHANSRVFEEIRSADGKTTYRQIEASEIRQLAGVTSTGRRAA